ncbi:MAG: inner-rane translocator, partial [Devosia sp.]|nr:inner-rane translocator [Devosia sp.]
MSDDATGTSIAEKGLAGVEQGVASFDEDAPGPIRRLQAFLHAYPTAIPFIVLIVGIAIFSVAAGSKFFA